MWFGEHELGTQRAPRWSESEQYSPEKTSGDAQRRAIRRTEYGRSLEDHDPEPVALVIRAQGTVQYAAGETAYREQASPSVHEDGVQPRGKSSAKAALVGYGDCAKAAL